MNRRQILKTALLAPFVGLFKPKGRKKLNVKVKIGETITVPKGQKWEIHNMTVESPTMGTIATATTNSNLTYVISGYLVE